MVPELPFPPPRSQPASVGLRWGDLARSAGLDPAAPALVALSGGADSVFLLHAAALAPERPRLCVVHVDHGLRGAESDEDARFCRALAERLGLAFVLRRVALEPRPAGLEARARQARYDALAEEARAARIGCVLTGHHADDALETLVLRWTRGSETGGLAGLRARQVWGPPGAEVLLARPLLGLRREEIRLLLRERSIAWREDSSNASPAFARNRVRAELLPELSALGGPRALDSLHDFAAAVAEFEETCARFTSDLAWQEPRHACVRAAGAARLPRAELARLATPLVRRVLARLLAERAGAIPERATLDLLVAALGSAESWRCGLPGGWSLRLRREELLLDPPRAAHWPEYAGGLAPGGFLRLPCGRALGCELGEQPGVEGVPRQDWQTELDADALGPAPRLEVRYPRPGDGVEAFGDGGSKRLARFLQDAGIPAAERGQVPLVFHAGELLWVAGVRPTAGRGLSPRTRRRLRLTLCHPEGAGGAPRHWPSGDFAAAQR